MIDYQLLHKGKAVQAKFHNSDLSYDPVSRKRHIELRISQNEFKKAAGGIEVQLELKVNYPQAALSIPKKFVSGGLEQLWVTNQKDQRIIIRPLRINNASYIIDRTQIPLGTKLKVPNK